MQDADSSSLSQLLRSRRFGPFFLTLLAVAVNENLFRQTLLLMVAFTLAGGDLPLGMSPEVVTSIAAGLFILPFFLLSPMAGQWADRFDKAWLAQRIRLAEVVVMVLVLASVLAGAYALLLVLMLLMGVLASLFTPIKYAILPEQLATAELVTGNALMGLGTFGAVLIGALAAGALSLLPGGAVWTALALTVIALGGYLASGRIPRRGAASPGLIMEWHWWRQMRSLWGYIRADRAVFLAMVLISWFWFLSVAYLSQFPNYAARSLNVNEAVVTLLLCLFTVGVGVGALACDRLCQHRLRVWPILPGALLIAVAGLDLCWSTTALASEEAAGLWLFFRDGSGWRITLDLVLTGMGAGLLLVPLYAYVQQQLPGHYRARAVAGLNVMNALFMVSSAILGALLLGPLGLAIERWFMVLGVTTLVLVLWIWPQLRMATQS